MDDTGVTGIAVVGVYVPCDGGGCLEVCLLGGGGV